MIWEFCVPLQPRTVELRPSRWESHYNHGKHDFVAAVPSILHACHDSRVIGLKVSDSLCCLSLVSISLRKILKCRQTYKLSFGNSNAKRPVYFNANIDTLFLRETNKPYWRWRDQAETALLSLPNKHEIQRLIIRHGTALYSEANRPPLLFHFPNLEVVAFVKHVREEIPLPCRESWLNLRDTYVLPGKLDASSTPDGFAYFINETRMNSLSGPGIVHMLTMTKLRPDCPLFSFAREVAFDRKLVQIRMEEHLERWRDITWNQPSFCYGGVSYERISPDKMFYKYERYNLRRTTKRKAVV